MADATEYVTICERLFSENRLLNIDLLYSSYFCRSCIYIALGEYDKGLSDINRSIDSREKRQRENTPDDEISLVDSYMIRSNIYINLDKFEEALDDINKCIEIYEKLSNCREKFDNLVLLTIYNMKSQLPHTILTDQERTDALEKAISYKLEIIKYKEQLYKLGELHDLRALADAYISYADSIKHTNKMVAGYYADKAIEIINKQKGKEQYYFESHVNALKIKCMVACWDDPDEVERLASKCIIMLEEKDRILPKEKNILAIMQIIKIMHKVYTETLSKKRKKQ